MNHFALPFRNCDCGLFFLCHHILNNYVQSHFSVHGMRCAQPRPGSLLRCPLHPSLLAGHSKLSPKYSQVLRLPQAGVFRPPTQAHSFLGHVETILVCLEM